MEIVRLQDGNSRGAAYCLPTASGSIHSYLELAKTIGPGHLVYGIRIADRMQPGKFREFASVQEMATAIVPGLLSHHRDGPIYLIGYSFAAYLAIELAQQLVRLGKLVPVLAIIDKTPPSGSLPPLLRMEHFIRNIGPFALRLATKSFTDANHRLDYGRAIVRRVPRATPRRRVKLVSIHDERSSGLRHEKSCQYAELSV